MKLREQQSEWRTGLQQERKLQGQHQHAMAMLLN
jgi:hypothetical protein